MPLPCSSLIQKVLLEIVQYHYTIQHWLFRSPAVRLVETFCQTTKKSLKEIKYLREKKTRNLIQEDINSQLTNNVTISATNCLKLFLLERAQGAGVWRGDCMSLSRMNCSFWLLSILPVSAAWRQWPKLLLKAVAKPWWSRRKGQSPNILSAENTEKLSSQEDL